MKKQPTPVQGYDTQIPSPRPVKRPGSRSKTIKPGVKPATVTAENKGRKGQEQLPTSELKSDLITHSAINDGDTR